MVKVKDNFGVTNNNSGYIKAFSAVIGHHFGRFFSRFPLLLQQPISFLSLDFLP